MTNPIPTETLQRIIELGERATDRPWEQMAGRHISFDQGLSPQQFKGENYYDRDYILAACNAAAQMARRLLELEGAVEDLRTSQQAVRGVINGARAMGDGSRALDMISELVK